MTQIANRSLWACLTAALVFAPVSIVLLPGLTMSPQQQAKLWLKGLSEEEINHLPGTLNSLPLDYQKVAYAALTPSQKADLWRSRLDEYSALHPNLQDAQRQVIANARSLATASFFEHPAAFSRESADMMTQAEAAFGGAAALQIFVHPWDHSTESAPTVTGTILSYMRSSLVVSANDSCYCLSDLYCSYTSLSQCAIGINNCDPQPGCGWFGGSSCTGMCAN
jgi:hypothetical protein